MILSVNNNVKLQGNGSVKAPKGTGFKEVLAAKTNTQFDTLLSKYRSMFDMTAVKVLDTSSIPGWKRKDFPKALLFDNNATIEDFKNVRLPEQEPTCDLDPGIQEAWKNIASVNGVAFVVHPDAVKQIGENRDFGNAVEQQLSSQIYPGMFEDIRKANAMPGGDVTDISAVVEIGADGKVTTTTYTSGYLYIDWGKEGMSDMVSALAKSKVSGEKIAFSRTDSLKDLSQLTVNNHVEDLQNSYSSLYLRRVSKKNGNISDL